ncbi:MAG: hypothetical protein II882_03155 [Lachnospiraceae bacterium]|nr:hypothetical protein [Lachnospiraceae bacterium]
MAIPFRITPLNEKEVLRRACCQDPSPEELSLLEECRRDAEYLLDYHITERNRPMNILTDPFLAETLRGCDSLIIFTASLGEALREHVLENDEPEKSILYQGLAAERLDALIESYCDYKERTLREGGAVLTMHFPYRWEGVPEDTFTATRIMGVSFHPDEADIPVPTRCRTCFVTDCPSRRE